MWTNGSRVARSTPAKARRTGKPSPSKPEGAVVTVTTGRSAAVGSTVGIRGRATVSALMAGMTTPCAGGLSRPSVPRILARATFLRALRHPCGGSDEGAEAADGTADDQGVHLPGALVGVDRLGVGHEAAHVVLEQDAVAAEQLPGPADRLAHAHGAERLGQRGVFVAGQPGRLQLRQPGAQAR